MENVDILNAVTALTLMFRWEVDSTWSADTAKNQIMILIQVGRRPNHLLVLNLFPSVGKQPDFAPNEGTVTLITGETEVNYMY